MSKRLMMLFGAVLMLSGCDLFPSQVPLPPLIPCQEAPLANDGFHEPYVQVAQRVPGFGGMFVNERQDNSYTLYVYLTDLSQKEAAEKAIMEIFGPRWPDITHLREIRVLQGQYNYLQLKEWKDCMVQLLAIPGVVMTGIAMEKNRVVVGLEKMERKVIKAVEAALDRLGIPREAVILEETGPNVLK